MSTEPGTAPLPADVVLRDTAGDAVPVRLDELVHHPDAGWSATFVLDGARWARLDEVDGFRTDRAARRGRDGARLGDDGPVTVRAVLDPDRAAALGIDGDTGAAELLRRVADAGPDDLDALLEDTEAWWATSVTVAVALPPELAGSGSVEEGFRIER